MNGKELAPLMDELRRIHQQIADISYRERMLKRSVLLCESEVLAAKEELATKRETLRESLLDVKQKEHEAAKAAQELERRKEQLNLAKSDREYDALKIQIQLEEKKSDSLADLTLEALASVDVVDNEIKLAELRLREKEDSLDKIKDAQAREIPKLSVDLERARRRLQEAESRLPRDWAGVYNRCVRDFGGEEAFVALTNGVFCGSCNCQVPIETVMKVCSGSAICCSSCGRLLYMPEGYSFR